MLVTLFFGLFLQVHPFELQKKKNTYLPTGTYDLKVTRLSQCRLSKYTHSITKMSYTNLNYNIFQE